MFNVLQPRPMSRRGFLSACGACAACGLCPPAAPAAQPDASQKAKVRLVFSYPSPAKEGWPYINYDYKARKKQILTGLTKALPGIDFMPADVPTAAPAQKLLAEEKEADGYVVYILGIPSSAARPVVDSGRPTVLIDDLYGGTGNFLGTYAYARRNGLKVAGVSSTRFEDAVQTIKAFEVIKRLKSSVILHVGERNRQAEIKAIGEVFGTKVLNIGAAEINECYKKADRAAAQKSAATWMKEAKKIVEPSKEEIGRSGIMYVAMKDLMARHGARAITVDCLNLFYGGKLPAYPCLGFYQLLNDGMVGACEADLQSTISLLLMTYFVGRPGYISDPVIDTSKNQIIYAHCVAPTKVYGPDGPASPYHIRDHSEDRKGAVVRALLPLGEMTTTLKFAPARKEVVLHQGKSVANIDEDKACRTKLAVEIKDPDKMLAEWDRWGWHRVTYYGDYRRPVEALSALMGFKVTIEG